jgi:uncharacterized protein YcbX
VSVLAIWRYPVKAMLGEALEEVEIGRGGCAGDRRWAVFDVATGARIANKKGLTDPRLRACRAELDEAADDHGLAGPPLRVTLPGGEVVAGEEIAPALSELLERRVRLAISDAPAEGRFTATGAYHDLAPVHLLPTSTLARLRRLAPGCDWDPRRFRPNLVLDDGGERVANRFAEDDLLGGRLRGASGLDLTVGLPTPRCVVPTRALDGLPADPRILRALVAHHRIDLGPFGRQGCAGSYAEVAAGARVRVGELLSVEHGTEGRDAVVARAVDRLRPATPAA